MFIFEISNLIVIISALLALVSCCYVVWTKRDMQKKMFTIQQEQKAVNSATYGLAKHLRQVQAELDKDTGYSDHNPQQNQAAGIKPAFEEMEAGLDQLNAAPYPIEPNYNEPGRQGRGRRQADHQPQHNTDSNRRPSASLNREPSAGLHKQPSAGLYKEPSAGLHKQPSAGLYKEPSAGKEPSASLNREPSAAPDKAAATEKMSEVRALLDQGLDSMALADELGVSQSEAEIIAHLRPIRSTVAKSA